MSKNSELMIQKLQKKYEGSRIKKLESSGRTLPNSRAKVLKNTISKIKTGKNAKCSKSNLCEVAKMFDTDKWKVRFTTHFIERACSDRNSPFINVSEISTALTRLKSRWDDVMRFDASERFMVVAKNNVHLVFVVTFEGEHLRMKGVSCIRRKKYFTELPKLILGD